MKFKTFAFFLTSSFWTVCAFATSFYGNGSDIRWKAAETDHFQFIYPAEYTSHASKASSYAEAVYDSVVNRYQKDLPGKVKAILNNALYSNGSAIPSENSINLWLTNWDFKIRSSHGWLTDVVTHEFSHLVSIENASKFSPSLYGFQVSYTDYYNERTTSDFLTMIPFTLQPLWFAEGTAQYESSRMGFDAWDTHRDMLLRVAALNDSLLPLTYMHDFSDNSLFAELGPYTQGFSLVNYIHKHYGENAVPKIWSALSSYHRATLDGALKKVLGIGEQELYDQWKQEITEQYKSMRDSLGTLVEGSKITTDAFWQDFPVVAGKHLYGVSNFGGPWFDGDVFKIPLDQSQDSLSKVEAKADTTAGETGTVSAEDISIESTIDISDYAKNGFKTKKAWFDKGIDVYEDSLKGPLLAYVSYQNKDSDGHSHFDITVSDTSKNQVMVTYLADAVYPAFSPKGNSLAFAQREPYSTRFRLSKVPFPKDFSDYTAEDPVDVYVPDEKYSYYNIYSPKFSPDGNRIAFGFFDNKVRGIAIVDEDGKNFKIVSNTAFDERDVNWIDNDKIVFASNRNGIFNLFEKNLSTGVEHPLTNVVGGAFTPALSKDTLYFTQYDKDGFSLYKIPYSAIPKASDTAASTITLYGKPLEYTQKTFEFSDVEFAGIEKDYKPIPTIPLFVPMLAFTESAPDLTVLGDGKLKTKAGLAVILSDPLKKNTVQMGLLLELGAGFDYVNGDGINPKQEKEFFVSWENKSTPLDLSLSYTYANYTSKDTVRYEDVRAHGGDSLGINRYAVPMQSIVGAAGYSLFKSIDTLQVAVGYNWANFNLYQDDFEWTYHKRLSTLAALGFYGEHDDGSGISGQGNGFRIYYQYANSDLYRPGTFAESFTVTSSGSIKPKYRNFNINEFGIDVYGSLQSPLTGARLAAGGKLSGIFHWNTDAKEDTLDSYYYSPLFLEGYPYLRNSENYTAAGIRNAVAELHYLFPIYDDWRKSLWIFETRSFYIHGFAQIGAAWNSKWFDTDKLTDHRFWDRSVGISFRMSNKIFNSLPFDMTFTLARGLSRIGEDENLEGGQKLNPIDLPLIPESIAPTRIKFSIGMGFANSWQ